MSAINKFMFVHPSRGRPAMAVEAIVNIISTMTSGVPYTYYLSVDRDDPKLADYYSIIEAAAHTNLITGLIVADNPHEVVQATNRGAALIDDEDIIICQTDDYCFSQGWDQQLIDFAYNLPETYLITYEDNPDSLSIAIPQILSKSLYKKLGYVMYPEYVSMLADQDLYEVAEKLNAVYRIRSNLFFHNHPPFRDWDETTMRTCMFSRHEHGGRVMAKRRSEGWIKGRTL